MKIPITTKAFRLAASLRENADATEAIETKNPKGEAMTHASACMREAATRLELIDQLLRQGAQPKELRQALETGVAPEPYVKPTTTLAELHELLDGNQLQLNIIDDGYEAVVLGGNRCRFHRGGGVGPTVTAAINAAFGVWKDNDE